MGCAITIVTLLSMLSFVSAQTENADGLKSCNVVCNCNSARPNKAIPQHELSQGLPGKLGPRGDVGPMGKKGDKGDSGMKGQKGKDADEVLLSKIFGAISSTSCDDLKSEYQISRSGYYLMMNEETKKPQYIYCDFTIYSGVSTCGELWQTFNLSKPGYYLLEGSDGNTSFHFCADGAYAGISTCQELITRYPTINQSGFFKFISSTTARFRVYCDFSHTPVITVIQHNLLNERKAEPGCDTQGCFNAAPRYDVKGDDVVKIIQKSTSCRQFLKLRCRGTLIRRNDYSWWVSRTGEKMRYWGGARRNDYCACGESNSCLDTSFKCNCDQNSNSITTADEGYLTDKTKLPIREIKIGDHADAGEAAWYTIGNLECFGQA